MGFKKNQKFNSKNKKISKINHSKLFMNKEKTINQTNESKKEKDTEKMEIEINNCQTRQKNRREKLIESLRGSFTKTLSQQEEEIKVIKNESENISSQNLSNLSSFYKEFNKVVETADVIIEVLDARDPLGTRCEEIERAVISSGPKKRLIFLLNKVDLIPTENLKAWLKYLRNEFPTIAFKASTQKQKSKLGRINKDVTNATQSMLKSSKCLGANSLMKILGNYCRNNGIRTAINVGVVGYPNVGKSSVINSLIRNKSCGVGSTPGFTKKVQYIYLDSKIRLLDCPGIVFAKANNKENNELNAANLALRNCIKIEQLDNPFLPVKAILTRVKKNDLLSYYKIDNFETVDEFLLLIAKRFGKIKKGGIPDTFASAKQILSDWNTGKIKFYTYPPEFQDMPTYISTEIIQEFSKGFDINEKFSENELLELDDLKNDELDSMITEKINLSSQDDQVDKDNLKEVLKNDVVIEFKEKKIKKIDKETECDLKNLQLNTQKKLIFKKQKKKQKRTIKLSEKMSKELEESLKLF